MKKGIVALLTILFFCNFGRVEYSALNPKAKIVIQDSTVKTANISSDKIVTADASPTRDQETSDASEENHNWSKYIVLGIKTFIATLLKILVA
jgi:uncharacterized protein YcfL